MYSWANAIAEALSQSIPDDFRIARIGGPQRDTGDRLLSEALEIGPIPNAPWIASRSLTEATSNLVLPSGTSTVLWTDRLTPDAQRVIEAIARLGIEKFIDLDATPSSISSGALSRQVVRVFLATLPGRLLNDAIPQERLGLALREVGELVASLAGAHLALNGDISRAGIYPVRSRDGTPPLYYSEDEARFPHVDEGLVTGVFFGTGGLNLFDPDGIGSISNDLGNLSLKPGVSPQAVPTAVPFSMGGLCRSRLKLQPHAEGLTHPAGIFFKFEEQRSDSR